MIGAICLKLNECCKVNFYLAGTYSLIDWGTACSTELGDEYTSFDYKEGCSQQASICVAKSLNDEYTLRFVETKRYILKIDNDNGDDIDLPRFQNEGNKYLRCDKDKDSVTFQFVNYLGRSKVSFAKYGKSVCFEVVPDKMNYEDDYIRLTEALADACSELLLDYAGSTSNVFNRSDADSKTLLEQFVFLRKFCYEDNLQGLFEAIKRNPERVLDQEEELKPIGTGIPSRKLYTSPFSYSRGWQKTDNTQSGSNMYLPQMVAVTRKFDRLDTPANRFIKYALHRFDSVCTELSKALEENSEGIQLECVEEANAIHKSIDTILTDSFFDDVGDLDIMPQNNQVLLKREGYSQIFSAYAMIDLALQLDWKGKDDIYDGESKNVALLYEYWLFFELYKIIKSIDGCTTLRTQEDPFLMTKDRVTVNLKEGKRSCQAFEIKKYGVKLNLYYNRTFSREEFQTTRYEGSYSRPFRPDYTLAIFPSSYVKGRFNGEEEAISKGAVSYMHFDAKYRITDLTNLIGNTKEADIDEDEIVDDKIDSVVNTYKRGDLLKMHTYNDAIRRTVGSYVLYPGSYTKDSSGNETFKLYDEILPGVGAFSIKPSIGVVGEGELKTFIESAIESGESNNSRLNRMKYYTDMILSEPSASGNHPVGFLQRRIESGDMYVMGYIRGDSEADYFNYLKNNQLMYNGSEFLFYFYAIKDNDVYSHHKDIFKAHFFRFYTNQIESTGTYVLEPVLCRIISNELMSRTELVKKLRNTGFCTSEEEHNADFYYVLKVIVENNNFSRDVLKITDVNRQNGNDTFSPHSPKVLIY